MTTHSTRTSIAQWLIGSAALTIALAVATPAHAAGTEPTTSAIDGPLTYRQTTGSITVLNSAATPFRPVCCLIGDFNAPRRPAYPGESV